MSRNKREGRYDGKHAGYHWRKGGKGLPDGLWGVKGVLFHTCPSCDRETEWNGTADEYEHPDSIKVCGGTQWCMP